MEEEELCCVGKQFDSFEEFDNALKSLYKKFCHPLRVYNSQIVSKANERAHTAKVPMKPIDKRWQYTYYVMKCVHFGEAQQRGKKMRSSSDTLPKDPMPPLLFLMIE